MSEPVPPADMIGNAQVRELCGGITRHTLAAWRRERGFPDPAAAIDRTEIWDRRAVTAWLKAERRERRGDKRTALSRRRKQSGT